MKENHLRESKGITVIVLIIIVAIVMTILIIVAIASSSNKKLENIRADDEVLNKLISEGQANNTINTTVNPEIDNDLLAKSNVTIIGTEGSMGYRIIIPAGFAPCTIDNSGNATKMTDVNKWETNIAPNINKGIVIIDKNENEFVWIPVKTDTYKRNVTYSKSDVSQAAYSLSSALPEDIEIQKGLTKPAVDDSSYTQVVESIERNAVEKSYGFYISRYEAGKVNGAINGVTAPISKRDTLIWDEISFDDVVKSSKAMYTKDSVRSTLITGIQWDMVMDFVDGKLDSDGAIYNSRMNNKEKHIGEISTTGKNVKDYICNIYDLEGNAWEYTAERSNFNLYSSYIYRGNSYATIGSASYRNIGNGIATKGIGFRVALYVL